MNVVIGLLEEGYVFLTCSAMSQEDVRLKEGRASMELKQGNSYYNYEILSVIG